MGSEKAKGWGRHEQRARLEAYKSVSSFVLLLRVSCLNRAARLKSPRPALHDCVVEGPRQRPGPEFGLFLVCWYQRANRQSSLGGTHHIIFV